MWGRRNKIKGGKMTNLDLFPFLAGIAIGLGIIYLYHLYKERRDISFKKANI